MQKRGEVTHEQLFQIIGITLVLGVVAFMYMYSDFVINDSTFERSMLSRDIGLLSNIILSSPGEIVYNYTAEANLVDYDFHFEHSQIGISEHDMNRYIFKFIFSNNLFETKFGWGQDQMIDYQDSLSIQKSGQKYYIGPTIEDSQLYVCPFIQTQTNKKLKILLDPLLDSDNPGIVNQDINIKSYELNNIIIESINFLLQDNPELEIELMHDLTLTGFSLQERQDKILEYQPNITIILNSTSFLDSTNLAKIYYPSNSQINLKSLKLSCLIANKFKENLNLTTILIPTDASLNQGILSLLDMSNQPTIFIEIADINSIDNNIFTTHSKISGAITDAIKKYE